MTEHDLRNLLEPQQRKELIRKVQVYNAAIAMVKMKLDIWNEEFKMTSTHNPIHHIESRIKGPESIGAKLRRQNVPLTVEMVEEHVLDLAGVRVVCRYIDDVYHIAELISRSDMRIIRIRDYISHPKPNGYRSYHVVLRVPVQLSSSTPSVPVEVQIRTIAMDTWASLEHEILYKVNDQERDAKAAYLKECAEELAHIDAKMQALFRTGKSFSSALSDLPPLPPPPPHQAMFPNLPNPADLKTPAQQAKAHDADPQLIEAIPSV